ncbi:PorT family protein [Flavobacterium sp. NRK F10]|uniref:porin family protein n=1 Tax=Flavobacterium sp. NRK F10 TaxID=2954931 RepID=UPI0020908C35|nr:porin family protein [Flavobacterium sp. NRK F10]MCO6173852.1 PorT family protein [Flavobacterium sp. NRK F10]
MKKKILNGMVLLGLIGYTTVVHSQSTTTASFGIKGGANFSNLYVDDVDDNNVLTGFNLGLFVNMPLNEVVSIQPEFLYSQKGAKLSYNNALATGEAKFRLNYLEVPVLLKLNVTPNFNLHAGPYVAYLVDSKVTNETNGGTFDFEQNINNDDLNTFDYGLSGGFGFDFSTISIGARYNYGLNTVGKKQNIGGTTYTFPDGKNSSVSVYMGIKF